MTAIDKCQIRLGGYYDCKCDGIFPHAPGWQEDVEVYAPVTDAGAFDFRDNLNEHGTVTLRMTPSAWHRYNISPDTYQTVNGDSFVESELEYLNEGGDGYSILGKALGDLIERHPIRLDYDHFRWEYNHSNIVREFAEELSCWMQETLFEIGLTSAVVEVRDTWSPAYYNFTSDGFEVDLTCDPIELRGLTVDFDVDEWAHNHYRSYDGFLSFVTSRMNDTDWHAEYDGGFRIESLFAEHDPYGERDWIMRLAEAEHEVYMQNVTVEPDEDRIRESILAEYGYMESGFTLDELQEWAHEFDQTAGMEPLFK
jgi:hypothetical protein